MGFSDTFIFVVLFAFFVWVVRVFGKAASAPVGEMSMLKKDISERHLPPIPAGHQILFGRVEVAGCSFRKADFCRFAMAIDKSLRLVAQPSNQHDRNAVMVIGVGDGREYHVGYLPRQLAAEIAESKMLSKVQPRLRFLSAVMRGYVDLEIDLTAEKSIVKAHRNPEPQPI